MEKLIKDLLLIVNQSGTREDLENAIQDAIKLHEDNSEKLDNSKKNAGQDIALLKERLAEQKLLSRKSEIKANNLLRINKQKNDTLLENHKEQFDQEKNKFLRKIESYEIKNKQLTDDLTSFPALQDELATIQNLLVSEKKGQEKLIGEKAQAEKELETAKIKLKAQSPNKKDSIAIKESIKQVEKYKTENLNLKKQVDKLNQIDKEPATDSVALEKEIIQFQKEIKELQEKLGASEVEKEELNKHREELLALQGEQVEETQRTIHELNILDEQSKTFKIINKLNDESFEVFKTALNSKQSFDERISKLDVFIKKTKEHIETITTENNDADSPENYSTDILDYFSMQIDKKETLKKILIKEKGLNPLKSEDGEGTTVIIQKKVNKGHAAHGGSWKVAYADFVTAMMAFFLMLWLLSMLSQESRDNLKEYFKSYKAFKHTGKQDNKSSDSLKQADSNSLNDTRMVEELKKKFKGADEHLKVENVPGGIRIQVMDLMDKPMFEPGGSKFTKTALDIMEFIAIRIKNLPGNVILEGHTDGTQYKGAIKSNWELSMERASAARIELVKHGMIADRIKRVIAYGGTEPIIPEDFFNPSNRRISILIITDHLPDIYKTKSSSENNEESAQH
mgnify:FL=1